MSISLVPGSYQFVSQSSGNELDVYTYAIGNCLVLFAAIGADPNDLDGVVGGGVDRWTRLSAVGNLSMYGCAEVWFGPITSTGRQTLTAVPASDGGAGGRFMTLATMEFTSSVGAQDWTAVTQTTLHSDTLSTSGTFPSLTPGAAGQLYLAAMNAFADLGISVSGSGVSYQAVVNDTWDPPYEVADPLVAVWLAATGSGAMAPTWADSTDTIYPGPGHYPTIAVGVIEASTTPPYPSLLSPPNNSYADLAANGVTLSWKYLTGGGGSGPTGYYLRRKAGGGAYSYWDAATQTFTTSTLNVSTETSVTIPASQFADDTTYSWSIAVVDAGGTSAYATDFVVIAQEAPTVTVSAPTGTVTSANPRISWTDTTDAGTIDSYRVVTYSSAQYGATGFVPGVGPNLDDSAIIAGNPGSYVVGTSLPDGSVCQSYVFLTQTPGDQVGSDSTGYTVALTPPATPTLTATVATDANGIPFVELSLTDSTFGTGNMMSAADASFETGSGSPTWAAVTNCTLGITDAWAADGNNSLLITSISSGTVVAESGPYPVTALDTYTFWAVMHQAVVNRSISLKAVWLNSTGGTISTSNIQTATESGGSGTTYSGQTSAPAGAVNVKVEISVASAGASEGQYGDEFGIFPGVASSWTIGFGTLATEVQRSTDGGVTWQDIRFGSIAITAGTMTLVDYEAPLNQTVEYQARVIATEGAQVIPSDWSTVESVDFAVGAAATLTDPLDTTLGIELIPAGSAQSSSAPSDYTALIETTETEQQGVFNAFGREDVIVIHGDTTNPAFPFNAAFLTDAAYEMFRTMRANKRVLLVRTDMGDLLYVSIGADVAYTLVSTADRLANPLRSAAVTFLPAVAP